MGLGCTHLNSPQRDPADPSRIAGPPRVNKPQGRSTKRHTVETAGRPSSYSAVVSYATAPTDDVPCISWPAPMSQTYSQPDQGLARAAERLARARSIEDVVAVLRGTARSIVGADGIAVILREADNCFYAAEDAFEILWQGRRSRFNHASRAGRC